MRNKSLHSSLSNESQLSFFICNCNYGDLAVVKKSTIATRQSHFFFPKTRFHTRFLLSPLAHSVLCHSLVLCPTLPFHFELPLCMCSVFKRRRQKSQTKSTILANLDMRSSVSNTVIRPRPPSKRALMLKERSIRFLLHYLLSLFQKIFLFQ